jgi:hypothetical protein
MDYFIVFVIGILMGSFTAFMSIALTSAASERDDWKGDSYEG